MCWWLNLDQMSGCIYCDIGKYQNFQMGLHYWRHETRKLETTVISDETNNVKMDFKAK